GELSAPAHRAPDAPRLLGDRERGQGNGRNDHSPTAFLADAPWAVADTAPQFPAPFAARHVAVASARRGAPRYPTGPPDIGQRTIS
ncbi:MAG TPA: hypothetical protein VG940_12235, partial [Gemmatimonadales bacterium]|nr:hypothetical protein [Gemmatimonadales bacterium]